MPRSLEKGRWAGLSRIQQQIKSNLGIIGADQMNIVQKFRDKELDLFDAYYENRQYDKLPEWDQGMAADGTYIPIRKRKPRIIFNVTKLLCDKVSAKLVGRKTFPSFEIESDPDDTEFFRFVQRASEFQTSLRDPIKRMLCGGSVFVHYYLAEGKPCIEWFAGKYCYPTFDESGELEQLEVKWVYEDTEDKDSQGNPRKKWYRIVCTTSADILFDNPEYHEGSAPTFEEVNRVDHGLGWVQGEWFDTGRDKFSPDGPSIIEDIMGLIDELNYNLSQSSQAVQYNQDPQMIINGLDEDEIESLLRSSAKAWNLGKDGKAAFAESNMKGVEVAGEFRSDIKNRMIEVVRIVLLDPEKIVGSAQSGKAMEVLHGPLVELVDELRGLLEPRLRNLLIKLGMTLVAMNAQGFETAVTVPAGYTPGSLDITVRWPELFPPTLDDIKNKVAAAAQATAAKIISRESATRWLAKDFGIENLDEELQKIAAEPDLNPFGTFGG